MTLAEGMAVAALGVSALTLLIVLISLTRIKRLARRPRVPLTAERLVNAVNWVEQARARVPADPVPQPRGPNGKFAKRLPK